MSRGGLVRNKPRYLDRSVVVETYKIRVNAYGAGKESRTPNALALGPKPSPYANSGIPAFNCGELNWLSYSRRTFLLSKENLWFLYTTPTPQGSSYKVSFQETLSLLKPVFRRHLYFSILVA